MADMIPPDSCATPDCGFPADAESALARITEALAAPGDAFYSKLFDYAAEELAVATVFVAGLEPGHESATIRSIATQGDLAVGDTYRISDTPCIDVIGGRECVVQCEGAEQACPGISQLVGEDVEGYIGFPLLGAYGQPLGLLVGLDNKPLVDTDAKLSMMRILGARAARQLERDQASEELLHISEEVERFSVSLQEKNDELEASLAQIKEMQNQLVQQAKMASLGTLAAGVAHEMNNPAAATQRGADQLRSVFDQLQGAYLRIGSLGMSDAHTEKLLALDRLAQERVKQPPQLDALARSDNEYEMETWLEEQGIDQAWELAPTLVSVGYDPAEMATLAEAFTADQAPVVIEWLSSTYAIYSQLVEIGLGATRMAEIVTALKEYTYMDQAPVQSVNVHEGLDNTLIILQNKLKKGITVRREYDDGLPEIEAYGSELNQVWTNIIDNAADAMGRDGGITLRTRRDGSWIVIEIEDDGPGIPDDAQVKVFDPFYTTKAVGAGTGLGLNISHNIVVQKHRGQISVASRPGSTCFTIRLHATLPTADTA
jgi:signal transduction histidine kinase